MLYWYQRQDKPPHQGADTMEHRHIIASIMMDHGFNAEVRDNAVIVSLGNRAVSQMSVQRVLWDEEIPDGLHLERWHFGSIKISDN